jgi:nicotinamidase-related amidase
VSDLLPIEPKTSALLVMDFQISIVDAIADKDALLARTAKLLEAARSAGVRVVHVVVGFREGYPEASPRNLAFAAIRATGRLLASDPGSAIDARVAPRPDEVVVTKHRVGAFSGTELEIVLRSNGIDTLILAGIATSGVVLSTLRHAADFDYRLTLAADCCADRDPEVHRVLTEKVFPRQATVASSDTIAAAIRPLR